MKFFILFSYCLVCNATILIKFGRVALHYKNRMKNGDEEFISPDDPFEYFGLQSRQLLCDAVINAKQFMFKYDPNHEKRRKHKITKLTNWNSLGFFRRSMTYNYQQIKGQLKKDPNSECLQYQFHSTTLGTTKKWQIKSIQCINEKTIKWFVAYGLVNKFMYLFEPGAENKTCSLRITGIFDPMAIVDDQPVHYFYDLFCASKDSLELIVCEMGGDDILHLCSAILVLLSPKNSLPNNNYVMKERQPCLKKDVKIKEEILKARFLRCTILGEEGPSTPFYVLGDVTERGAVFVFVVGESFELELYAHVLKVPSLMNPVGQMNRRYVKRRASPKRDTKEGQPSEISLPDLWGQKAQRSLRVP